MCIVLLDLALIKPAPPTPPPPTNSTFSRGCSCTRVEKPKVSLVATAAGRQMPPGTRLSQRHSVHTTSVATAWTNTAWTNESAHAAMICMWESSAGWLGCCPANYPDPAAVTVARSIHMRVFSQVGHTSSVFLSRSCDTRVCTQPKLLCPR